MQTGTAERFSKQLGNELRRKYGDGVVVEVVDIENYKAEVRLPKEKLVLYLMATYGKQLDPSDMHAESVLPCLACGKGASSETAVSIELYERGQVQHSAVHWRCACCCCCNRRPMFSCTLTFLFATLTFLFFTPCRRR